jgi:hypothetical protein
MPSRAAANTTHVFILFITSSCLDQALNMTRQEECHEDLPDWRMSIARSARQRCGEMAASQTRAPQPFLSVAPHASRNTLELFYAEE